MRHRTLPSTQFLTLVSLVVCYSVVTPSLALIREPGVTIARTSPSTGPSKANLPRKAAQSVQKPRWRDGELLVRFRQDIAQADIEALLQANGARRAGRLRGQSGIERLRLNTGLDVSAIATIMSASQMVDFAEPNFLITADQMTPDDPRFSEQWALKNTGVSGGHFGSDINASRAWEAATGSRQTVIAVLDSGIDFTHPDLLNNAWKNSSEQSDNDLDDDRNGFINDFHGWDFVADSSSIIDANGHGTAVAGIIAAQGNNSVGITGVMWQASLMSVRVLDERGTGDVAGAVEAIDYAVTKGAQVINCSWGTDDASNALLEALTWAGGRGVVVVTSAGNEGRDIETTPHYPASFNLNNLISVASIDSSDRLATWSNRGAAHVSIAAPGTDILTTKRGGDYQTMSGTSASAPFVTGVVGLIKSLRPWLNVDRTRAMIIRGARGVPAFAGTVSSGSVLNAAGALTALNALPPTEGMENGHNDGEPGADGNAGGNPGGGLPGNGNGIDRGRPIRPSRATPGAPGAGLPNLDELRGQQPTNPKAADPIPSSRCSHKDPNCAADKRKAAIQTPSGLLAWVLKSPSISQVSADDSRFISDSPFRLFWSAPAASLEPLSLPQTTRTNVALAANGSVATASSNYSEAGYNHTPGAAINDERKGLPFSSNLWHDAAPGNSFPDWLQIDFNRAKIIDEVDVFTLQDNYANPVEPTETTTFTLYGLTGYEVQYWNGSAWVNVPGGNVTANNKVWRKFNFSPVTTTKIRVLTNASGDGYSRITEVQAWGVEAPRTNFALSTNGGAALASSLYSDTGYSFTPGAAINGDRIGLPTSSNLWHDAAPGNTFPDWLQVNFNGTKVIDEINVFSLQDAYASAVEPNESMTFSLYGLTGFEVQYWNGSSWVNVPGGNITNNNKVWRKLTFAPVTTDKIRVLTNAAGDGWSRIIEVEAWGTTAAAATLPTQSVVWTNIVGVTATGNNLSKPSGHGWDAGAVSVQSLASGNGYAEFTATETNFYRMFGLSNGDSHQNYDDIDFAIELSHDAQVHIYEAGVYRGQFGSYSSGDRFRVSVVNGMVKYSKNGTVFYTSTVAPTYPLSVDTSLYSTGATITNAIISGETASNSYLMERLDPKNRTGSGGVDLLSRNANWSLPILSLKGRAGLDLGLSLSYNSLVWTKSQDGASIKFDADQGTPSPGFRLGFPVIQPRYYNSQAGAIAYLLITPSGGHVELRQVGSSNVYESADSSYLQLTENGSDTMTLRPTDGSQLTYQLKGDQYQCTGIKDRNGNYITLNYDPINNITNTGRLTSIVDTLGRTINFNYDGFLNLNSITQDWGGGVTHPWVNFNWTNTTVNPGFSNLTVVGPSNGMAIPVINQVSFADGTRYNFEYNDYAQVTVIRHRAEDTHQLSYTLFTHAMPAGLYDCPRVTARRDWAQHWNGDTDGNPDSSEEALTSYSTASDYSSGQMSLPDNTIYRELFATTNNWQKRLTVGTEIISGGVPKKWTTTTYTQDDTNLTYQKNPRVTETNVYDSNNHKRTTIDYGQYAQWGLPYQVTEYDADGVTPLRRTFTDYNLAQIYLERRIIGLPSQVHIADANQWLSKIAYYYDAGGDQLQPTVATTTRHDDASYGTGFSVGRGNLTAIARFDVTDITNNTKRLITSLGYDTNGSVIFMRDPLDRQTNLSYADSFSDNNNTRYTFAYLTTATPPLTSGETAQSFSTTAKYNYYTGAVMREQGPLPAGHSQGRIQTYEYDSAGRVTKVNNLTNNAYLRWVYHPAGHVSTYVTMQTGGQETFSTTVFDGMGRVRGTSGDNPDSAGGYRGQFIKYDIMGRSWKQSNEAEMTSSWVPSGDDVAGLLWTEQLYDWKGRPTVTTNPDLTTKTAEYDGCGCAGRKVITIKDEVNRLQKITSDALGRPWKTEVMNPGGTTVYATTTNAYNARDQITSVYEIGSSGAGQTTTLTYDGYGRLKNKVTPQQTANSSITNFIYNADDTIQQATDWRGAITTYTYNVRRQVTNLSYNAPTGIASTASVSYGYDPAGNRVWMTDGLGRVDYEYDALSQLTSEIRQLDAVSNPTSGSAGKYKLSYQYTLSGALKSIEDPFGDRIDYALDQAGRITGVSGTPFGGFTQYASNIKYRAWGAPKSINYSDGLTLDISYNQRLAPSLYDLTLATGTRVMGATYQYYDDGRLRFVDDLREDRFDRRFEYDHVGRVTKAESGYKARGTAYPGDNSQNGPYNHYYGYDQFNHLVSRTGSYWYRESGETYSATYANNKNINAGWNYDADGRVTQSQATGSLPTYPYTQTFLTNYTYDAAGRRMDVGQYDGDGLMVKPANAARYYIRSSVLNGLSISEVFSELKPESVRGGKASSFVYLNGEVIVEQFTSDSLYSPPQQLKWQRRDPARTSIHFHDEWNLPTSTGGMVQLATDIQGVATESPDYVRLQQQSSYYNQSYSSYNYGAYGYGSGSYRSSSYGATGGMPGNFGTGCSVQGMLTPCSIAVQGFNNGSLTIDPRHFSYGWNRPPTLDLPINSPVSFLFSFGVGGDGRGGRLVAFELTNSYTGQPSPTSPNPPPLEQAKFDFEQFKKCVNDLGVELLDFKAEVGKIEKGFKATFFSKDAMHNSKSWSFPQRVNDMFFKAEADYQSKTAHQIALDVGGLGGIQGTAPGETKPSEPQINYIAKELIGSNMFIFATWIHEVGNTIHLMTGRQHELPEDYQTRYKHKDGGVGFEECVFKGKVSPDGTLNRQRR